MTSVIPLAQFFLLFLFLSGACFAVGDTTDTKSIDFFEPKKEPGSDQDVFKTQGGMGSDFRKFGEEVAQRIDRIVKKKTFEIWGDPWTMQGIPIVFPSNASGFNLGLRLQWQNIRRQDPHEVEVIAQVLASDRGRQKHIVQVDFPWAFKNRFRVTTLFAYDRDVSIRYFGIGNKNPFSQALLDANDPLYSHVQEGPTLSLSWLYYLTRQIRVGPVLSLKWTNISAAPGSVLEQQQPSGVAGGRSHSMGLALIFDTLDFEPYPSRGNYHELFFNAYQKHLTGSQYDFTRTTYTFRKFISLNRRLIFAHRTLFEYLSGDVPFFELGAVGGTASAQALGGDRFLRGYEANRFIDKIRLIMGFELRWDPIFAGFFGQDMTVGFVPFFDVGRVWPDKFPNEFDNWHASGGWGLRFIWNSRLVLRFDTAFTLDGARILVNLGNSF